MEIIYNKEKDSYLIDNEVVSAKMLGELALTDAVLTFPPRFTADSRWIIPVEAQKIKKKKECV